ncbi:MAG: ABC transporter substrate-binding protein [Oscillospiraceae bacterium]|jgi:putative ABC transport system substrate-binding protein|nr:ABC transporter substrate-binding protein [Oscillospiraceae bacterium]
MKKILALIFALALASGVFSCGTKKGDSGVSPAPPEGGAAAPADSDDAPAVGIVQYAETPALDAAREGFIKALADNGYVDGQTVNITAGNAAADSSGLAAIADQFIGDKVDLILAIATPAAQAVAGKTGDIPILGTAVTDYVTAGLVDSNDTPGRNVSGTSDINPVEDQLDLIFKFHPNAKTIGFVYNSGEDNSKLQIDMAKAYIERLELTWKEITVTSSNDVRQAVISIAGEVDALYLPTDNTLAAAMPAVCGVTADSGTPVICADTGMVKSGGLAALGIDYYRLGYQTGLMAVEVLRGNASPATMPVQYSTNFVYAVNAEAANAIGIAIPPELERYIIDVSG